MDFLFAFAWVVGVLVGVPLSLLVVAERSRPVVHFHYHQHDAPQQAQVVQLAPPPQRAQLTQQPHAMVLAAPREVHAVGVTAPTCSTAVTRR